MAVDSILACNGGSSTLKLARFTPAAKGAGWQQITRTLKGDASDLLRDFLRDIEAHGAPDVILHRIVHAGLYADLPGEAARYARPADLSPRWAVSTPSVLAAAWAKTSR